MAKKKQIPRWMLIVGGISLFFLLQYSKERDIIIFAFSVVLVSVSVLMLAFIQYLVRVVFSL